MSQQENPGNASWCNQHQMRQVDCHDLHYPKQGRVEPVSLPEMLDKIGCQCLYADGKWRFYDVKGNKIHVCGLA